MHYEATRFELGALKETVDVTLSLEEEGFIIIIIFITIINYEFNIPYIKSKNFYLSAWFSNSTKYY
jgi:hypothetical protein